MVPARTHSDNGSSVGSDAFVDRFVGCIVGGAVGDAMGGAREGSHAGTSSGMGAISDDTQLTLATCEAIAAGAWDLASLAARFLAWYRAGRLSGLGASTLTALRELDVGAPPSTTGRRGEYAAGNGAAMRIAPLAFLFDPAVSEERDALRETCFLTHRSDEAYCGALAVVGAIRCVVSGGFAPGDSLLTAARVGLPDTGVRDALDRLAALPLSTAVGELARSSGVTGHVVESVPFAIAAAERMPTLGFERMLREVVDAGGDTDTNASICGQIVGAWLGRQGLDESLAGEVDGLGQIEACAREAARSIVTGRSRRPAR